MNASPRPQPAQGSISALLLDAPVGRHFAQLHSSIESRCRSVTLFIEAGLRRGQPVVAIVSSDGLPGYLASLAQNGILVADAERSGQLVILDAEATLEKFMRGGMPSWIEFRQTMGTLIERLVARGQGGIRAYGEMVSLLWQRGNHAGALALEQFWNDLTKLYPFSLFCGYMMDHVATNDPEGLMAVAHAHCEIVPTEEDDRFQDAIERACRDVYGVPLDQMVERGTSAPNTSGEGLLPGGRRTAVWLQRNMPSTSAEILKRASDYFRS